jgi:hypothetical protein
METREYVLRYSLMHFDGSVIRNGMEVKFPSLSELQKQYPKLAAREDYGNLEAIIRVTTETVIPM